MKMTLARSGYQGEISLSSMNVDKAYRTDTPDDETPDAGQLTPYLVTGVAYLPVTVRFTVAAMDDGHAERIAKLALEDATHRRLESALIEALDCAFDGFDLTEASSNTEICDVEKASDYGFDIGPEDCDLIAGEDGIPFAPP